MKTTEQPQKTQIKRDVSPALSNVHEIKKRLQIKPTFDSSSKITPLKQPIVELRSPIR